MKIRSIIIEDEEPARELIKVYLLHFPDIELLGEYSDGFSGLKGIQEHNPDIVFLDVQMPRLTGFELLEVLDVHPEIIFTTAYDHYAIKAFEHNAVDYLLKPFSEERFRSSVEKAIDRLGKKKEPEAVKMQEHFNNTTEALSRVVVKSRDGIKVVPSDQIIYIEAQDDYVMIHIKSGKYLKQKTMRYYEMNLGNKEFIRVHRSYLVRIDQIHKLEPYEKNSWIIILSTGQKIPVSRSGYMLLKEVLDL